MLRHQVSCYSDRLHRTALEGDLSDLREMTDEIRTRLGSGKSSSQFKTSVKPLIEHRNGENYQRTALIEASGNITLPIKDLGVWKLL